MKTLLVIGLVVIVITAPNPFTLGNLVVALAAIYITYN